MFNRTLIFAAILLLIPLLFPTDVYSQECSRWEGFKRITFPCPTPTPGRDREVYIPPSPEEIRLTEAREQNDLGLKAMEARNWAVAAQHFEQAVAKDPNSTSFRANLSNARAWIEFEARKAREDEERRKKEALEAERKKLTNARGTGEFKPIGSSELFGLKPSNPGHSDLRPLDNRIDRDFGKTPMWGQLNCAVDLMGKALSKLTPENGEEPSFTESRTLLDEAVNALRGESRGLPCSMGGPLPRISGRTPDFTLAVKKERALIERARTAIDELEKARRPVSDEEGIAIAHAQSEKNKAAIAQRDAAAIEQARNKKRLPRQIIVPSPTLPPKPKPEPKTVLDKISAEAQEILVSFHLRPRRSPPPPPNPRPSPK